MAKKLKLAPLHEVGWLAEQSQDFNEWAEQVGRWKTFKKGQFIYHAGDRSDGLYGLASGTLQMTFPLVAEEPVVIHRAEIGFWIGDAAELTNRPRMVTLMAASQAKLLHLPSSAIKTTSSEQAGTVAVFLSAECIEYACCSHSTRRSLGFDRQSTRVQTLARPFR